MPAAATTGRARTRKEYVYQELRGYVEAGFTAVKIKVGRLPLEQELRRVRKAREAIGPDTILMMDANNAWPDAAAAIPAIRAPRRGQPVLGRRAPHAGRHPRPRRHPGKGERSHRHRRD